MAVAPARRLTSGTLLTPAEMRVASLLAQGRGWREIMAEMHISRTTLSNHRAHAITKYPPAQSMIDVFRAIGWLVVGLKPGTKKEPPAT